MSNSNNFEDSTLIRTGIQDLADSQDPNAFLVIRHSESEQFVQFAGSELFFDLPRQALSDSEFDKATKVLGDLGIKPVSYQAQNPHSGRTAEEQIYFQKNLAGNVDEASRVAEAVFLEVYGINRDAKLTLSTN